MQQSGFDINDLVKEAQCRWLKPAEVYSILQNHESYELTHKAPNKPITGSLFLFNKRVLRFFRRDGHNWRKKKDGTTVGEAHEKLKVGNSEGLNCYYAHGQDNPTFQRRCYWMLDPAYEHIVLVHYRDINDGNHILDLSSGSFSTLTPTPSPNACTSNHNPHSFSLASEVYQSYHNSLSPGSVEVSSDIVTGRVTGIDHYCPSDFEKQALQKLKEQLSLNDESYESMGIFLDEGEDLFASMHIGSNSISPRQGAGEHENECQNFDGGYKLDQGEMLESSKNSVDISSQDIIQNMFSTEEVTFEELGNSHWLNYPRNDAEKDSMLLLVEEKNNFPLGSLGINYPRETILFDQIPLGMPLDVNSSLTVAQEQKFTIREISPEWGYTSEVTKVVIIGSFFCNPSETAWQCMFGNIEVPAQIIQEGVVICEAPSSLLGKVNLCLTSGNRESCSEVREFEFRAKSTCCSQSCIPRVEVNKNQEELLLLVRFVQMLLSDAMIQKPVTVGLGADTFKKLKAGDDVWDQVMEDFLVGGGISSMTTDWLLQELLRDKLQHWIAYKSLQACDPSGCVLPRKEQGIIHMVAGLGYEWALNPILSLGIGINFRDINGWTALHWAARFGREKMVASLIALGASAGVVTDPHPQVPTGKTPASIAADSGHKGLAGYLSELALTTHLSSLKLEESELSIGSAELEAELTVNSISNGNCVTSEDQLSLKDTLSAVRNASQAAARIQSAFRAHSFRRRQERTLAASCDEYGISPDEAQELSKLAFRNSRDYNVAALSIQKKYRGWKGHKDFLTFRQKVVKIQAHVRGYQVRKNYKVCWAVSILDKVVLRWRRKGVGLRGFRPETEYLDESEDEDIVQVFRKQKVDASIDEAVSRVLSMVECHDARQQYRRMLEKYREAKAELVQTASVSQYQVPNQFP